MYTLLLIVGVIVLILFLTFFVVKKRREGYTGTRWGKPCNMIMSYDEPNNSLTLIVQGYNYSKPPKFYEMDGRRLYPIQYDHDMANMMYYYVFAPQIIGPLMKKRSIMIETEEDVAPVISIEGLNTKESPILNINKVLTDHNYTTLWSIFV
jgi:hypothetical protein